LLRQQAFLFPVLRITDQQHRCQDEQQERANRGKENREGWHQQRASQYGYDGDEVTCSGVVFWGFIHFLLLLPTPRRMANLVMLTVKSV